MASPRGPGSPADFGAHPRLLVVHPNDVRQVLQEHHSDYEKGPVYHKADPLFGDALFMAEGEAWLQRRRVVQGAFRRERLAELGAVTAGATASMFDGWRARAEYGEAVDLWPDCHRLILTVLSPVLFGTELTPEIERAGRLAAGAMRSVVQRMQIHFDPLEHLPFGRRGLVGARRSLEAIAGRLLEARHADDPADDLLGVLLRAGERSGRRGWSEEEICQEVAAMIVAGIETTASALAWLGYLLATQPESAERAAAETAAVLGERPPTIEDLAALPFGRMFVQETLRLYPPLWGFYRTPLAEVELGGCRVPAGATLVLVPYLTHRHPEFWERPEAFEPERFSAERSRGRPFYAYFPFGGGPRVCLGMNFALTIMQLVLASIVQRFRPRLAPGHRGGFVLAPVLQPRHGVLVQLDPLGPAVPRQDRSREDAAAPA